MWWGGGNPSGGEFWPPNLQGQGIHHLEVDGDDDGGEEEEKEKDADAEDHPSGGKCEDRCLSPLLSL